MGIDKKYALLDTDFLYKSHLARNAHNHTLSDLVMDFQDYEFFCHEMMREELTRHEVNPNPAPWLEDKINDGFPPWSLHVHCGMLFYFKKEDICVI